MSKRTMAISVVVLVGLLFCTFGSSERSLLAQGESTVGPQAVVTPLLQYQGRLTNPNTGDPLDGTYQMTFRLYDVAVGGTSLWAEAKTVQPHGGLFSVVLGDATPLSQSLFNGRALWLGITVGSDAETMPRQQILPVAYALSLVPGAVVVGNGVHGIRAETASTSDGHAAVVGVAGTTTSLAPDQEVGTLGKSADGYGVAGMSNSQPGVWGYSEYSHGIQGEARGTVLGQSCGVYGYGSSNYGGCFASGSGTAIYADGALQSSADSYVWIPGMVGISDSIHSVTVETSAYGRVALTSPYVGQTRYFHIPIAIPSVLYGQEVTVEELTVFYHTDDPATYINITELFKLTSAASSQTVIYDGTNRNSTSAASYSLYPSSNNVLSSASGPLNIRFALWFGSTGTTIYIGGIRLRLGHQD